MIRRYRRCGGIVCAIMVDRHLSLRNGAGFLGQSPLSANVRGERTNPLPTMRTGYSHSVHAYLSPDFADRRCGVVDFTVYHTLRERMWRTPSPAFPTLSGHHISDRIRGSREFRCVSFDLLGPNAGKWTGETTLRRNLDRAHPSQAPGRASPRGRGRSIPHTLGRVEVTRQGLWQLLIRLRKNAIAPRSEPSAQDSLGTGALVAGLRRYRNAGGCKASSP